MDDITSKAGAPPLESALSLEQTLIFPILGKQTGFYFGGSGGGVFHGESWSIPTARDPIISGIMLTTHRIIVESQRRQQRWNSAVMVMRESIRTLANEVTMLKCEIQRLHNSRTYVVPLATLTPAPFQMVHQIPVTIEGDGEDFTATFVEANISASGETEADAIANFKDSLLSSYEVLEGLTPNQLGPLPTRQWGILQSMVKRTD